MINRFIALAALAVSSAASQAAVIDFNDNPNGVYFTPVVISDGFIATATSPMGTNFAIDGAGPSDGTVHLDSWTNSDSDSIWTLTSQSGSAFNLQSFDFATGDPAYGGSAGSLTVTGTRADGTTVSEAFTITDGSFQTLSLSSGFSGLSSVTFDAYGGMNRAAYDNIAVSSVPEPTNAILLALGLAGIGIARRKHRA